MNNSSTVGTCKKIFNENFPDQTEEKSENASAEINSELTKFSEDSIDLLSEERQKEISSRLKELGHYSLLEKLSELSSNSKQKDLNQLASFAPKNQAPQHQNNQSNSFENPEFSSNNKYQPPSQNPLRRPQPQGPPSRPQNRPFNSNAMNF